jgi:DNA-directed RNA polymerase subunit RPC12/RpoP
LYLTCGFAGRILASRFYQGGTVIKFRCPSCGQKIAANDQAADKDVACPSCVALIVVPWRSAPEFLKLAKAATQPVVAPADEAHFTSVPPPFLTSLPARVSASRFGGEHRVETEPTGEVRRGVVMDLARMMMNRLFQAVLAQRSHLLDTQHRATARLLLVEQRMAKVQEQHAARIAGYEKRIRDLERQVQILQAENNSLVRDRLRVAGDASAREYIATAAGAGERPRLSDADFLLRV